MRRTGRGQELCGAVGESEAYADKVEMMLKGTKEKDKVSGNEKRGSKRKLCECENMRNITHSHNAGAQEAESECDEWARASEEGEPGESRARCQYMPNKLRLFADVCLYCIVCSVLFYFATHGWRKDRAVLTYQTEVGLL